jgi:hypothetical protein
MTGLLSTVRAVVAASTALAALCGFSNTVALQDAVNGVIPGPPTFYKWVLPLDYNGSTFSIPKAYTSCGTSWDAQPYFSTTDGSLTPSGPIVLPPECAAAADPNTVPSSADTPAFYVVAVPLSWANGKPGGRHFDAKSSIIPAIAIAGPVDPGARSWAFAPLHPGLTMRAGYGYMFFVAQLAAI